MYAFGMKRIKGDIYFICNYMFQTKAPPELTLNWK